MELVHFKISEFDSPDVEGSGINMDVDFLLHLDKLRGICGFPFKITSGYRTEKHNEKVGGKRNSAHTRGKAVDIAVSNSFHRHQIVKHGIRLGITRFGLAKNFVHIDMDETLSPFVIWTYD